MNKRTCPACLEHFVAERRDKIYCSSRCRTEFYSRPIRAMYQELPNITKGARGAISELQVCADLMARGYHVYRCVSAHAPCDLMAWRGAEAPIRIEVKTGIPRVDGTWCGATMAPGRHVFEVLAIAIPGAILYHPALPDLEPVTTDGALQCES